MSLNQLDLFGSKIFPERIVRLFKCKVCGVSVPRSKGALWLSGFICDKYLRGVRV